MIKRIVLGRAVLLAGAAVTLTFATGLPLAASTAGASSAKPWSGPPSYQPLRGAVLHLSPRDTTFTNVDYNGGPVMPSNTDYLVFWSPKGYSAYGSGTTPEYVSGLEQYIKDLAHDSGLHTNTDSVSTQYNDASGKFVKYSVTFGGAILDTDPYPTGQCPATKPVIACMTDLQMQAELKKVVSSHHLTADLTHEYFLLTPPNVANCFSNSSTANPPYGGCSANMNPAIDGIYCAYHSNTVSSPLLLYAIDPYVTGNFSCEDGNHPNGPSDGAIEGGLSHEHNESITDPIPNDAWTNGAGINQGQEIGDQCDQNNGTPLGKAPNSAEYNQKINGHFYWYQEEWSNEGHACMQRFTLSGAEPVAKFTAAAGSGTHIAFNATGSTAPGGIADYVWQFNDANGAQTIEQKTPTINHAFPAAGSYSVGLTIYGKNGASIGAGGIVTTSKNGLTPGFTVSPAKPVHGTAVNFSALTTVSRQTVKVYFWEFGDGGLGSGAKPSHTYAKAGTYTVTLVMFSGVGSAFPGVGAAPITTQTITVS
jgi:PKD repeat protein